MAVNRKVFLIGPGFIGGEVLDILVAEGDYDVTTMVRRQEAVALIEQAGAKAILGSLSDSGTITQQVEQADIVIHTATADDLPSVEAVLAGVEARAKAGKPTIYIHTSGASLIGDESSANFKSDKIFHDDRPEEIDALPDSAPHRLVDLAIVKAGKKLGKAAKMAIMIPPLIYGVSGREKRLSIQLPTIVRYSIKHGYAGHVGKGLSVWSQVHVTDLARAYVLLLHWLEGDESNGVAQNPYFFCENGEELSWGECATEIGKALHSAGKLKSPNTATIPEDLYGDVFGRQYTHIVAGSNSRNRANRLRKLGWQPREKGTLASLREDEIPMLIKETGNFNGYSKAVAS